MNIKEICLIALLAVFSVTSCIHETRVMEETYPMDLRSGNESIKEMILPAN